MSTSIKLVEQNFQESGQTVSGAEDFVNKDEDDHDSASVHVPLTRSNIKSRRTKNQEAVATLLASFGDDVDECGENLIKQDISYKDLASLTKEDLILLGITDPDKQEEILDTFRELPKQNSSYDDILKSHEANLYNSQILSRTASHMDTMKTAISATNLKLKVRPSGDVVLEDKNFASKFVLEALDELRKITEEIEDRLSVLEEMTDGKGTSRGLKLYETFVMAGLAAVSFAIWYWKFR